MKFLAFLFLGMLTVQAQTTKKPAAKKKPAAATQKKAAPATADGIFAVFETSKGNITVELKYKQVPVTVANFVSLAEGNNPFVTDAAHKGKPFFDGLKFHRVIADFMIQGGDPMGTGQGNPGYSFKDEIVPEFSFDKGGILAMANSGPSTNGSQFFITHKETPWLTGKHTIYGYVTSGQDVVNKIAQNDVMNKVVIVRKGADAKNWDAVKIFSDYMKQKPEEDKKLNEQRAKEQADREEARKKQAALDAEAKRVYDEKYAPVKAEKVKELAALRAKATKTPSGLEFASLKAGNGTKPTDGQTIYFSYAGYLEDGALFDSSYEDEAKRYGKWDENRSKQNGYNAFPYQIGNKGGLIAGFVEGLDKMTFNERAIIFIPANLGYGAQGAGGVIPPNSNIIFVVEMFDAAPTVGPVLKP